VAAPTHFAGTFQTAVPHAGKAFESLPSTSLRCGFQSSGNSTYAAALAGLEDLRIYKIATRTVLTVSFRIQISQRATGTGVSSERKDREILPDTVLTVDALTGALRPYSGTVKTRGLEVWNKASLKPLKARTDFVWKLPRTWAPGTQTGARVCKRKAFGF
jgi:hypothetical protein